MKQTSKDKYSIAWFKLAQYVSRGERERAMGIYRLLSHSIDNQAFARQLEGDILLFFNDESALSKYKEAAALYLKQNGSMQAAAVYEQILSLDQYDEVGLSYLFKWSQQHHEQDKMKSYGPRLIEVLLKVHKYEAVETTLYTLLDAAPVSDALLHSCIAYLKTQPVSTGYPCLTKVIEILIKQEHSRLLSSFLAQLEVQLPEYAQKAQELLRA